jgi:hypothetical protein
MALPICFPETEARLSASLSLFETDKPTGATPPAKYNGRFCRWSSIFGSGQARAVQK